MKTMIILVDFSETSANAVKYAAGFSADNEVGRIVLLKSFYTPVYEQILPTPDLLQVSADDISEERERIQTELKVLASKLIKKSKPSIKVETAVSELPLLRAIQRIVEDEQPDLLIAGSDGNIAESFIGTQVIEIAKTSTIPVLIIPADASYAKIEKALVPCDFDALSRVSVLQEVYKSHRWLHPELLILYVDPEQKHLEHVGEYENSLKQLLQGYKYEVFYSEEKNTVLGILDFAQNKDVQVIVALPGKYSFFYNLTHRSITEALSKNPHLPVIILK